MTQDITHHAGLRLEYVRNLLGFSVVRICDSLGITRTTYYDWRKREEPTPAMVLAISKRFPEFSTEWVEYGTGGEFSSNVADIIAENPASPIARHFRREGIRFDAFAKSKGGNTGGLASSDRIPYNTPPQFVQPGASRGSVGIKEVEVSIMNNGHVTIKESGIYFVDIHDISHATNGEKVAIRMIGDSMRGPFGFAPGTPLIVTINHSEYPASDGIYVLRVERSVHVKQLQCLPGNRVQVKAFNPSYDPFMLNEGDDFEILGKVEMVPITF